MADVKVNISKDDMYEIFSFCFAKKYSYIPVRYAGHYRYKSFIDC